MLAYPKGLEPLQTVLETVMLPLHQGYIIFCVETLLESILPVQDTMHIAHDVCADLQQILVDLRRSSQHQEVDMQQEVVPDLYQDQLNTVV